MFRRSLKACLLLLQLLAEGRALSIPVIDRQHSLASTLFRTFMPSTAHASQDIVDNPGFRFLYYVPSNPYVLHVAGRHHVYRLDRENVEVTGSDRFMMTPRLTAGVFDWSVVYLAELDRDNFWICANTGNGYAVRKWELRKSDMKPIVDSGSRYISGGNNLEIKFLCPRYKDENFTIIPQEILGQRTLLVGRKYLSLPNQPNNEVGRVRRNPISLESSGNFRPELVGDTPDGKEHYGTMLNPDFVASFEINNYIYMFLSDSSISDQFDQTNGVRMPLRQAKVIRLCKNETANLQYGYTNHMWATLRQARIECSVPSADRSSKNSHLLLNNIAHISWLASKKLFFALFNTGCAPGESATTAVCTFTFEEVEAALDSTAVHRDEQGTWQHHPDWKPYQHESWKEAQQSAKCEYPAAPNTAPGSWYKAPGFQLLTAKHIQYFFDNTQRGPTFFMHGIAGRKIHVEHVQRNAVDFAVIFIVSNHGDVLRLSYELRRVQRDAQLQYVNTSASLIRWSKPLSHLDNPEHRLVYDIKVIQDSLYLAAWGAVVQLPLHSCDVYLSWETCVRDPACGWTSGTCQRYAPSSCIRGCGSSTPPQEVRLVNGQPHVLRFSCHAPFYWKLNDQSLEAVNEPEHVFRSAAGDLVLLNPQLAWHGRHVTCYDSRRRENVYHARVAVTENHYKKAFDNWCDEFEKYKHAFNSYLTTKPNS